jgi:hypothetical protein
MDSYSHADLIDRVLDRGIVIDAAFRFNVAGVHLIDVDTWIVVASLETYDELSHMIGPDLLLPPWMRRAEQPESSDP